MKWHLKTGCTTMWWFGVSLNQILLVYNLHVFIVKRPTNFSDIRLFDSKAFPLDIKYTSCYFSIWGGWLISFLSESKCNKKKLEIQVPLLPRWLSFLVSITQSWIFKSRCCHCHCLWWAGFKGGSHWSKDPALNSNLIDYYYFLPLL